MDNVQIEAI